MRFAAGIDRPVHPADRINRFGRHVIFRCHRLGKTLRMPVQADLQPVAIGAAGTGTLAACGDANDGPVEEAGEEVDEAVDEVEDEVD